MRLLLMPIRLWLQDHAAIHRHQDTLDVAALIAQELLCAQVQLAVSNILAFLLSYFLRSALTVPFSAWFAVLQKKRRCNEQRGNRFEKRHPPV
jgi:hypothetical protein